MNVEKGMQTYCTASPKHKLVFQALWTACIVTWGLLIGVMPVDRLVQPLVRVGLAQRLSYAACRTPMHDQGQVDALKYLDD